MPFIVCRWAISNIIKDLLQNNQNKSLILKLFILCMCARFTFAFMSNAKEIQWPGASTGYSKNKTAIPCWE